MHSTLFRSKRVCGATQPTSGFLFKASWSGFINAGHLFCVNSFLIFLFYFIFINLAHSWSCRVWLPGEAQDRHRWVFPLQALPFLLPLLWWAEKLCLWKNRELHSGRAYYVVGRGFYICPSVRGFSLQTVWAVKFWGSETYQVKRVTNNPHIIICTNFYN